MSGGERIRKALDARGLTARALADHLGVSPQSVTEITSGRRPGTSRLAEIADFLSVSVEYITTGVDAPAWDRSNRQGTREGAVTYTGGTTTDVAGTALDVVARVKAGDGDVGPWQPLAASPCQIPDSWKLVEVEGMSAYPVIYPGQLAAIDLSRAVTPPMADDQFRDLHDNICVIETSDHRAYIKRFCWAPEAPDGYVLASIDAGRSSPFVPMRSIESITPVVAVLFQDPRKPRKKRWHAKTVIADIPEGLRPDNLRE